MKQFNAYREVLSYSKKRNKELTVKKFNHKDRLFLFHGDCSIFSLTNFLVETVKVLFNKKKQTAYIIYTEHHGACVYFASDLRKLDVTDYATEATILKSYKATFLK